MNQRPLGFPTVGTSKWKRQRCLEFRARFLCPLLVCTGLLVVSGCASGDNRVAVEGTVMVDGKPMGMGSLALIPLEEKARTSGEAIANGKFSIPAKRGPTPGKEYRVEVHWGKPTGRKTREGPRIDEEYAEGLPDKYHKASTLTAKFTPGTNRLDLDLQSK